MDMQHGNVQHPSSTQPAANVRVTPGTGSSSTGSSPVAATTLDVGDLPFTIDNGVIVKVPAKAYFDLASIKRKYV